jgi:formylglycine-generating enzyme required for sulfatase activity
MRRSRRRWAVFGMLLAGLSIAMAYWVRVCPPAAELTRQSVGAITFVSIPEGEALLGSPETEGRVSVKLPAFWLARHETTVEVFAPFAAEQKRIHPQLDSTFSPLEGQGPKPVTAVDLATARAFAVWFSRTYEVVARLPTEEEWEFAARGGLTGAPYAWGFGTAKSRAHWDAAEPSAVGAYPANAFGLFDMSGNVYEWCEAPSPNATRAVARGGSWAERDEKMLRLVERVHFPVEYRDADLGFRLLIESLD